MTQHVHGAQHGGDAPVRRYRVVVRQRVAHVGEEEPRRHQVLRPGFKGQLPEDEVFRPRERHVRPGGNFLHHRAGEEVARPAAGGFPLAQQGIPDQAVPGVRQFRQPGKVQVRVVVALENPVEVVVLKSVAEEGQHLGRKPVVRVRGAQPYGIAPFLFRRFAADKEQALHALLRVPEPGVPHGVAPFLQPLAGTDAHQDGNSLLLVHKLVSCH
ncbi:hypothetical protein QET40_04570 [Akkermansia sp. N21169]|uniref:hypothetical protein n=1 Tax=Akkermansia sp. N21169 TaxID=3040765 RepID=UPI00244E85D1|nr:hypothetical protein [Akkermansia sp. N21169]MDH3068382.1 hypothetical protein [Akkermansia sp. N21169]